MLINVCRLLLLCTFYVDAGIVSEEIGTWSWDAPIENGSVLQQLRQEVQKCYQRTRLLDFISANQ
jgi:hypothetical protein